MIPTPIEFILGHLKTNPRIWLGTSVLLLLVPAFAEALSLAVPKAAEIGASLMGTFGLLLEIAHFYWADQIQRYYGVAVADERAREASVETLRRCFVSKPHLDRLVDDVWLPVTSRLLLLQGNSPIADHVALRLTLESIELTQLPKADPKEVRGRKTEAVATKAPSDGPASTEAPRLEIATFLQEVTWKAVLPERSTGVGRVATPIFVCTSAVLHDPALVALEELGVARFYYPLHAAWGVDISAARRFDWISDFSLKVGSTRVPVLEVAPSSFVQIRDVLAKHKVPENDVSTEDVAKRLFETCLRMVTVEDPDSDAFGCGKVKCPDGPPYEVALTEVMRYRVCIRGVRQGQLLYRYEVPIAQSCRIESIRCEIAGGGAGLENIVLEPPVVQCAFALADQGQANGPQKQWLTWKGPDGSTLTPFLPGHGVTFVWRRDEP